VATPLAWKQDPALPEFEEHESAPELPAGGLEKLPAAHWKEKETNEGYGE